MNSLQENMQEFRTLLGKGVVQKAYLGLMQYMMALRTTFEKKYPAHSVTGLYQGYMDMTYFSITPKTLQDHKLKIALVFNYEAFRFEVWLAAFNKQVQTRYWTLIKESGWNRYPVVPSTKGYDAIIEHPLVDNPDFGNPDALTAAIDAGVLTFTKDIETFLLDREN